MSELRRWSEEGATAEEMALLDASRRERAPAEARARALRALGAAAGATAAGTTTSAAAATKGVLTITSKIAILSLVGGGVVAGGLAVRAARHPEAPPTTVAAAAPTPVANSRAPEELIEPANVETPAASPSAAPSAPGGAPPRAARPASTSDQLSREVKALELAHRALVAHDPREAIALLDRYRAQFPAGSLASEALVLRAQALLASGDRAGAQALADTYSAAHPNSPYAIRLKEIVRGP